MNVKVIFIFTLITKVYCEYGHNELSSSKLLKHLKTIASNENFVGHQNNAWVYHTRKVDTHARKPGHYDHPVFNDIKTILNRKKNIRKRNVMKIGVNCPEGSVRLPGSKKCNCTEDGDCIRKRKIGNKIEISSL